MSGHRKNQKVGKNTAIVKYAAVWKPLYPALSGKAAVKEEVELSVPEYVEYTLSRSRSLDKSLLDLRWRAEEAFDELALRERCIAPMQAYWSSQIGELKQGTDKQCHLFLDRGAKILGVAHLDSVKDANIFIPYRHKKRGACYFCTAVDDRVGVYVLLDLLPKMGIQVDVLLTEGEEIGRSTAADFVAPEGKQYNWIFAFDRRGDDVVLYQYENDETKAKLAQHDLVVDLGSFSDIAFLEHLGVVGMNFGSGYHNEHWDNAFVSKEQLINQIARFASFYEAEKDNRFEFDGDRKRFPFAYGRAYSYGYRSLDDWYDEWGDGRYASRYGSYAGSSSYVCTCGGLLEDVPPGTEAFCPNCGAQYLIYSAYNYVYNPELRVWKWIKPLSKVEVVKPVGRVTELPNTVCAVCGATGSLRKIQGGNFAFCTHCEQLNRLSWKTGGGYEAICLYDWEEGLTRICRYCQQAVIYGDLPDETCRSCGAFYHYGEPASSGKACDMCGLVKHVSLVNDPSLCGGEMQLCNDCTEMYWVNCPRCGAGYFLWEDDWPCPICFGPVAGKS